MKTIRRSRALHNCKIREIVAVSNWQSQRNCGPVKLAKFDSVALCKLAKFNKAAACKFAKLDEVGFCELAKIEKFEKLWLCQSFTKEMHGDIRSMPQLGKGKCMDFASLTFEFRSKRP